MYKAHLSAYCVFPIKDNSKVRNKSIPLFTNYIPLQVIHSTNQLINKLIKKSINCLLIKLSPMFSI
jgi:hypothetical protein